ncbi:MAG: polysaccharide deacetylase family protein [Candidatus Daviesbacteria bacterium]|nr:polysaccharide deacetylase family protein [Candidatus Daviesbacteria bacterium]
MSKLNIVFHKITTNPAGNWEVSPILFRDIFKWCQQNYEDFQIYFDDGYDLEIISNFYNEIAPLSTLAIVTDDIEKNGFFSWEDLSKLSKMGFNIASHSVTHPSMSVFDQNNIGLVNPSGGIYSNVPRGKQLLTMIQVKFQIVESKKVLVEKGFRIREFVFPYGLYSQQTINLLNDLGLYDFYATCDNGLDEGVKIISRNLIHGTKSLKENIRCLTKIIEK